MDMDWHLKLPQHGIMDHWFLASTPDPILFRSIIIAFFSKKDATWCDWATKVFEERQSSAISSALKCDVYSVECSNVRFRSMMVWGMFALGLLWCVWLLRLCMCVTFCMGWVSNTRSLTVYRDYGLNVHNHLSGGVFWTFLYNSLWIDSG